MMIKWPFQATTLSHVLSYKQIGDSYKDFHVETNVQTLCGLHDLNMDSVSFDNGFKQPKLDCLNQTVSNCMGSFNH